MSSSPRATRRSAAAASSIPRAVRTEWSSLVPESHSGYQTCSAPGPRSTPSSPTSTTSRSEYGASSDRPYPPTATSAAPCSGSPAAAKAAAHLASAAFVPGLALLTLTPRPRSGLSR